MSNDVSQDILYYANIDIIVTQTWTNICKYSLRFITDVLLRSRERQP